MKASVEAISDFGQIAPRVFALLDRMIAPQIARLTLLSTRMYAATSFDLAR
jgi:hypothetical protein